MKLTREELDEMLRRADHARVMLRRATIELQALGEQLMLMRSEAALLATEITDHDVAGRFAQLAF